MFALLLFKPRTIFTMCLFMSFELEARARVSATLVYTHVVPIAETLTLAQTCERDVYISNEFLSCLFKL